MINTISTAADDQLVPVVGITAGKELEEVGADWSSPAALATVPRRNERGMVSAEWAVGIIAAIAIAGVLLTIVTSGPVKAALLKVILMIIGMFTQNAHFLKL